MLNDVTDGGSINPTTGLPEFFVGSGAWGGRDAYSGTGSRADKAGGVRSTRDRDVFSVGNNYFTRDGRRAKAPGEAKARETRDRQERVKQAQKIQAKETAVKNKQIADEERRQDQKVQDEERRARQYANMPDMTDPDEDQGMLSKSKTQDLYANIGPSEDEIAEKKQARERKAEEKDRVRLQALEDKPNEKITNNRVKTNNLVMRTQAARAAQQQRLTNRIKVERRNAAQKAPGRTFTDAQFRGAAQANLTKAKGRKDINDLISRSRSNSAQAQVQGQSLTPAQSLNREIDKIRTAKANARAQNNTTTNTKPQEKQPAAISPNQPQTTEISDKVLGDGIQTLNATVKSIDPNMSFSYNELVEATQNILSQNGKTSAVQDYLNQNNPGLKESDLKPQVIPKNGGVFIGTSPQEVGWSKEELQMPKYTTSQQIKDTIEQFFIDLAGVDPKDPPPIGGTRG